MDNLRIRTSHRPIEIRDSRRLCFYAAVFDSETTVCDLMPNRQRTTFREVVKPGAFRSSLVNNNEVLATIDHDESKTFARRSTGDLILQEDRKGLFASAWIPETPLGDQLIKDVEAELMTGCSFKSRIVEGGDIWQGDLCQVVEAPLLDVCITANPAYQATSLVRMRTEKYKDWFRRIRILNLNTTHNLTGELWTKA